MVAVVNVLLAAVTVVAFALCAISFLAWRRARDAHMLLLTAAFAIFFVKGLFLTVALFGNWTDLGGLLVLSSVFDLAILVLFYGFTLRR